MVSEREVLHVDDDPQTTRLLAGLLKEHGYSVTTLNDPTEAINELVHGKRRVVLLDIDMPGIGGLEVLRQIKEYDGGVQVIMLSGVVTVSSALQALRAGAEACFFKPVDDIEPIVEALDAAFRKIDHWWEALRDLSSRKHSLVQSGISVPTTV